MKKLLYALVLLLTVAQAQAAISDNLLFWFTGGDGVLNNTQDSVAGLTLYNLIAGTTSSNCAVAPCYLGSANMTSGTYIDHPALDYSINSPDGYTLQFWFRSTNPTTDSEPASITKAGSLNDRFYHYGSVRGLGWQNGSGTNLHYWNATDILPQNLNLYTFVANATHRQIWLNGTLVNNSATTATTKGVNLLYILASYTGANDVIGTMDEIAFWNRSLTSTEIACIYNSGTGVTYSTLNATCGPAPPAGSNFTITAKDLYAANTITEFYANVTHNGTTLLNLRSNSSGTLDLNFTTNDGLINATICAQNHYCNTTINHDTVAALEDYLFQAQARMYATEVITGANIVTFTATAQNQTNTATNPNLYISAGTHPINFSKTGYFPLSQNFTITALTNNTHTFSGVYAYRLNITFRNVFNNATVNTYTVNVTSGNYSYTTTNSTTNGSVVLPWVNDTNAFFIVDAEGYAITNHTANITSNGTTNIDIYGYTNNSIYMVIRRESDGTLITSENISIVVSGATGDVLGSTLNGTYYIDQLTDGNYSIKFDGQNWSQRNYVVTVADRSSQILNAYLANGSNVIMTFVDRNTGAPVENAITAMARTIGGTWTTIETRSSGPDGRSLFTYDAGVRYRFVTTHPSYLTNSFYLDPILFSTYTIRLETSNDVTNDRGDFAGVSVVYSPTTFTNAQSNNFTFLITSPEGTLSSYLFNLSFPAGIGAASTNGSSGSNSYGETFTVSFTPNANSIIDLINLTYRYTSTEGYTYNYTTSFYITGSIGNNTLINSVDTTSDMGAFEYALIATILTMFVWGMVTMYAGSSIGAITGILFMGVMAWLGFIPMLLFLVSGVAAFGLLTWRSAQ